MARYAEDVSLVSMGALALRPSYEANGSTDIHHIEDIVRRLIPHHLQVEVAAEIVNLSSASSDRERTTGPSRQVLLRFVAPIPGSAVASADDLVPLHQLFEPGASAALDNILPCYSKAEAFALLQALTNSSSAKIDRRLLRSMGKQLSLDQLIWITSTTATLSNKIGLPLQPLTESIFSL